MKVLKFRAWEKDERKWLRNTNEPKDDNLFIEDPDGDGTYQITQWGFLEICLYIGLSDKNNKEIYENYILKDEDGNLFISKLGYVESVLNGECFYNFDYSKCEIIGNIYENPEILENKKF